RTAFHSFSLACAPHRRFHVSYNHVPGRFHEAKLELACVGRVRSRLARHVQLYSVFLPLSEHTRCPMGEPITLLGRRMLTGHRAVPSVCPIKKLWRKDRRRRSRRAKPLAIWALLFWRFL